MNKQSLFARPREIFLQRFYGPPLLALLLTRMRLRWWRWWRATIAPPTNFQHSHSTPLSARALVGGVDPLNHDFSHRLAHVNEHIASSGYDFFADRR